MVIAMKLLFFIVPPKDEIAKSIHIEAQLSIIAWNIAETMDNIEIIL